MTTNRLGQQVEGHVPSPEEKVDHNPSVQSAIGFLERFGKEAETARRDAKRLEKARADLDKRREQIEQRMRQA